MPLPFDILLEILDQCDPKTARAFLRTCHLNLRHHAQRCGFPEVMFSGNVGDFSLGAWPSEEREFQERAKRVKAIFYNCGSGQGRLPPGTDYGGLLSSFIQVESLRLAGANLMFAPNFMVLNAVRSLSLENCRMYIGRFLDYLRSFPQLEFLSISSPAFVDETLPPVRVADDFKTRQVALQLKSIQYQPSRPLINALSVFPFAFTEIHLCSFGSLSSETFSELTKQAVTKIKVGGRWGWVNLMSLQNVERVELFDFRCENIPTLQSINPTKLKALLITTNREYIRDGFWEGLDSALVTLRSLMGNNPLNFYLTSDDDEFNLEERKHKLLQRFTKDEGVIINKSLVKTSMEWEGSSLHGTGRRYSGTGPC